MWLAVSAPAQHTNTSTYCTQSSEHERGWAKREICHTCVRIDARIRCAVSGTMLHACSRPGQAQLLPAWVLLRRVLPWAQLPPDSATLLPHACRHGNTHLVRSMCTCQYLIIKSLCILSAYQLVRIRVRMCVCACVCVCVCVCVYLNLPPKLFHLSSFLVHLLSLFSCLSLSHRVKEL